MEKVFNFKICEGVDFSHIKTDKFKTASISITFFVKLDEKSAAGFATLISLLSDSCKKFKNFKSLNGHIEEMYGASLGYEISKIGKYQTLELYISSIDDKFIPEKRKNTEKISELLCELIFNPLIINDRFDKNTVIKRKNEIIELIENQISNKSTWSIIRCNQIMFKNESCGISKYGTKNDVLALDEKSLIGFYKKLIENSRIKIFLTSNSDCREIVYMFKKYFSEIKRKIFFDFEKVDTIIPQKANQVVETMSVEQCKLVMGFRTPFIKPEDTHGMTLAAAILGGVPTSKLFVNVREKMNLCYYCSSAFNSSTGVLYISSGIEHSNLQKVKDEILNQIKLIREGKITEEEINDAKEFLIQKSMSVSDVSDGLHEWYLCQYPFNLQESPEDYADKISQISKQNIVDCISKISLDTIYVLKGEQ